MNVKVKSTLQSNTIRTCIVGFVAFVAALGVKWQVQDEDINKIADAAVIIIPPISLALAAWFRRSTNVVVPGAVKESIVRHTGSDQLEAKSPFSGPATPLGLLWLGLLLALSGSGCMSRTEHAIQRNSMQRACEPIHREHLAWARELAKPGPQRKLPDLFNGETDLDRQNWLKTREGWHREYDQTMTEGAENDAFAPATGGGDE
jgi:hypothetical protein